MGLPIFMDLWQMKNQTHFHWFVLKVLESEIFKLVMVIQLIPALLVTGYLDCLVKVIINEQPMYNKICGSCIYPYITSLKN